MAVHRDQCCAGNGITTSDAAASRMPTVLCSGGSRVQRALTAQYFKQPRRTWNLIV